MALPLIIPIIALVTYTSRRMRRPSGRIHNFALVPLILVLLGAEGVVYDYDTRSVVTESRILEADHETLLATFNESGQLPTFEPLMFKLPFPRPTSFENEGVELGDLQKVWFGAESVLVLEVTGRTDSSIEWSAVEDTTPMSDWMTFRTIEATWVENDEGLLFSLTIEFDRRLAPAFYFGPLQRWGVSQMADVLIDMVETNLPVTP